MCWTLKLSKVKANIRGLAVQPDHVHHYSCDVRWNSDLAQVRVEIREDELEWSHCPPLLLELNDNELQSSQSTFLICLGSFFPQIPLLVCRLVLPFTLPGGETSDLQETSCYLLTCSYSSIAVFILYLTLTKVLIYIHLMWNSFRHPKLGCV